MKTRLQISRKRSQAQGMLHPARPRPCLCPGHSRSRIGATGASVAGRSPPVIFQPHDGLIGKASDFRSDSAESRPPDERWDARDWRVIATRGSRVPGEGNGLAFEVIAEREVTQHLKEGQCTFVADDIDIGGAKALLCRGHQQRPEESRVPKKRRSSSCMPAATEPSRWLCEIRDELGTLVCPLADENFAGISREFQCVRISNLRTRPSSSGYKRCSSC